MDGFIPVATHTQLNQKSYENKLTYKGCQYAYETDVKLWVDYQKWNSFEDIEGL